jgi:hypothetical protein
MTSNSQWSQTPGCLLVSLGRAADITVFQISPRLKELTEQCIAGDRNNQQARTNKKE